MAEWQIQLCKHIQPYKYVFLSMSEQGLDIGGNRSVYIVVSLETSPKYVIMLWTCCSSLAVVILQGCALQVIDKTCQNLQSAVLSSLVPLILFEILTLFDVFSWKRTTCSF